MGTATKNLMFISFMFLLIANPTFCVGQTEFTPGNTDGKTPSIRDPIYDRHRPFFNQPGIDLPTGGMTKGRIAIESDGNVFATDDLGAMPCGIAILWKKGLLNNIVHIGYNNNPNPDRWANTAKDQPGLKQYKEYEQIIDSTVEKFGVQADIVFNYANSTEITKATENLAQEINASSAANPLYIVEAGVMFYLYKALAASDMTKHPFVTVITHSGWNDIECHDSKLNENIVDVLRDFTTVKFDYIVDQNGRSRDFTTVESGTEVKFDKIVDQNTGLRVAGAAGWDGIEWMRTSTDSKINWLYTCAKKGDPNRWGFLNLGTEVDFSDAGIFYYLVTGNGNRSANFDDLRTLFTQR